jgi:cytoskeletal protein RodZ
MASCSAVLRAINAAEECFMTQAKESRPTSDKLEDSFRAIVLFVVIGLIAAITEQMSLTPAAAVAIAPIPASATAEQSVPASAAEYSPAQAKSPDGVPAVHVAAH